MAKTLTGGTYEAADHEALPQDALPHDALDHAADPQEALPQEALPQEALPQEAFETASIQAGPLKTGVAPPFGSLTRKEFRARFGFGGSALRLRVVFKLSVPTPPDHCLAAGRALAPSMRAPLTWSGVQLG